MVCSDLSLIFELPQQSTSIPIFAVAGLLGALLGAVAAGWIKYAMERKNRLLQAYSQLIGKKFILRQEFGDVLISNFTINSLSSYLKKVQESGEKEKYSEDNLNALDELTKIRDQKIDKSEKFADDLVRDIERFWKTIGIINGILSSSPKIDRLIEDVRIGQNSLKEYQDALYIEAEKGFTNPASKKSEIKIKLDDFEMRIDNLIDYLKDNEINKHWWKFLL